MMMLSATSPSSTRPMAASPWSATPTGSPYKNTSLRFGQQHRPDLPSREPKDTTGQISLGRWIPTLLASLTAATAIGFTLWQHGEKVLHFLLSGLK